MKNCAHLWWYLAGLFLEWEMFQLKVVEEIKAHVLFSIIFHENRTVYELMRKKIMWSLRSHFWRYNAVQKRCGLHTGQVRQEYRHTHTQNTYCFPTTTVVKRTLLNVTLYEHCLPCVIFVKVVFSNVQLLSTRLLHGRNNCRFKAFAVIWILYMFFWVFPRRQYVICRRFGTIYQFHLQSLEVD